MNLQKIVVPTNISKVMIDKSHLIYDHVYDNEGSSSSNSRRTVNHDWAGPFCGKEVTRIRIKFMVRKLKD